VIDSDTYTTYTLRCDLCGNRNRSRTSGVGIHQTYKEAHEAGWLLAGAVNHQDLCPRCVPTVAEACS
jgi:hypothetical protein